MKSFRQFILEAGVTSPTNNRMIKKPTPLTPQIKDLITAAGGFSGQGPTPINLPKPRGTRGGSSTLPNIGRGVEPTPSGRNFIPGTGENFGISGIGLPN